MQFGSEYNYTGLLEVHWLPTKHTESIDRRGMVLRLLEVHSSGV